MTSKKRLLKRYLNLSEEEKEKGQYTCERYGNLSKEQKKRQYSREWYRNLMKNEKERLSEFRKNYSKIWKKNT